MKGATEVRRRIGLIDGAPPDTTTDITLVGNLNRVIRIMEQVTNTWFQPESSEPPTINPEVADSIVAGCEAVSRIAEAAPALAAGPLALDAQVWTGASEYPHLKRYRPRQMELAEQHFVPLARSKAKPKAKPWDGGLFTCTLVPGTTTTMWLMYQESFGDSNSLFPKPWYSYLTAVSAQARIYEANSAEALVALVQEYPLEQDYLLYPDWVRIANHYDAVHVTVPAIVATQGMRLTTATGVIADAYWDVEQTLWLNWSFDSADSWIIHAQAGD